MPRKSIPVQDVHDPEFRPASYVGDFAAVLSSVRGELRRRRLVELVLHPGPAPIEDALLATVLEPEVLRVLRAIDPELAAGEMLPPLATGETEIARLLVRWPVPTAFSARSRVIPYRRAYGVVGEYGSTFTVPMPNRPGAMSTREVVDMFWGMRETGADPSTPAYLPGIVASWKRERAGREGIERVAEASSLFYPKINEALVQRLHEASAGGPPVDAPRRLP